MDYVFKLLKKKNYGRFKNLINNPWALSKFIYVSVVFPQIDNYFLTDKADGIRAVLILTDKIKKSLTSHGESEINFSDISFSGVFDCELVDEIYYIFDVIEYNGKNISESPFSERYNVITEIGELLQKSSIKGIAVKKFRKLSNSNYIKEISAAFSEKRPYEIDGLIFTQDGEGYNKTQNLKWKPPEQLTIDFLYLGGMLWVGISKKEWYQYGFALPDNYVRIIAPAVHGILRGEMIVKDYFPVPFITSLGDFSKKPIIFPKEEIKNLEGKILELSWNANKDSWVFNRIRKDKEAEFKVGHSFGNNFSIAEKTLQLALNPLTFDVLLSDKSKLTKGFYFEKQDETYKAVRKFNNYVKDVIIKKYKTDTVIDLASGKGQDLVKYVTAKVKTLLMLEIDMSAIDELLARKYDILGSSFVDNLKQPINTRGKEMSNMILHIRQMNLNDPWENNIKMIKHALDRKKPGTIFCNLALHYMMIDKSHMDNICALIGNLLSEGGEFVFTAFDGKTVFDLIKNAPFKDNNRYLIELVSKSDKFIGFEKINVLLPCSSVPYEEPLINLFELDKSFNKYDIVRIEHRTFIEFLNNFKEYRHNFYNELSEKDKEFISLYSYTVYKKIQ